MELIYMDDAYLSLAYFGMKVLEEYMFWYVWNYCIVVVLDFKIAQESRQTMTIMGSSSV